MMIVRRDDDNDVNKIGERDDCSGGQKKPIDKK